jgi:3-oxoacyl-[acyl-carrier-protein] synthase-3
MKVAGIASFIPENAAGNAEIEARLGLEAGWIERRTGIRRRPAASPEQATSDLAIRASERALLQARIEGREIGLFLLATSTPDHLLPPTAPLVAHQLSLSRAGAVDVAGACAGFVYALVLAQAFGRSTGTPVLVTGANVLTRRTNQQDPATVGLFSDGAGAMVLVPSEPSRILGFHLGADGSFYDAIGIQAGGSRGLLTPEALQDKQHLMMMRQGPVLFKQAVQSMATAGKLAMQMAGTDSGCVDWWVPHQSNARITQDTAKALGIPQERTISVIDRYGNSSSATIPIALAYGEETGRLRPGHVVLLTAVGAGLLSAGLVLRW